MAALAAVGFNPQSQPLWPYHWTICWGLTQKIHRLEFDLEYTSCYTCSSQTGPACVSPAAEQVPPTDPDASYDYGQRLAANPALGARLHAVANTGAIQHPLITLHGDLDSLLPLKTDSEGCLPVRCRRSTDTVVSFGRGAPAQLERAAGLDETELEQRARLFIGQVSPGIDLARLVPNHSAKRPTKPGDPPASSGFRWENRSASRPARCAGEAPPCSHPGKDVFVQVVLSHVGEVLSYINTLAYPPSGAPAVPTARPGG